MSMYLTKQLLRPNQGFSALSQIANDEPSPEEETVFDEPNIETVE